MDNNLVNALTGNTVTQTAIEETVGISNNRYAYDAKNIRQVNALPIEFPPLFILLVGDRAYGKSTLTSSIYNKFTTSGEFCGWKLIDSETWVGFERRAYLRRLQKDNADDVFDYTKRTMLLTDDDILHLKLSSGELQTDLLISDRDGEYYKTCASRLDKIEEDNHFSRANHITFFINEELLLSQNIMGLTRFYSNLLSKLVTKNKISLNSGIEIVFTKGDIIRKKIENGDITDTKETIASNKNEMINLFKLKLAQFDIAIFDGVYAKDVGANHGGEEKNTIEPIFKRWMEFGPKPSPKITNWVQQIIDKHE